MLHIDVSVRQQVYITDPDRIEMTEVFNGMRYGMMLNQRSDDMPASEVAHSRI